MITMSQNKKILVVEDEEASSLSLKDTLIAEGFDVVLAKNGEEGLALALREKPELLLLDVMMPKMDGMTMMSKLREDRWGKDVPIIVLTVLDTSDAILKSINENKPSYYFIKENTPISTVIEKIRTIPGFAKEIN